MRKIYIVRYYGGSYDDWYTNDVFVTDKKSKATKYVTKFNKMLSKWKEHYKQYEDVELYFDRWNSLQNITKSYVDEIDFR